MLEQSKKLHERLFVLGLFLHCKYKHFISTSLREVGSNFTTAELVLGVRLWRYYSLLP